MGWIQRWDFIAILVPLLYATGAVSMYWNHHRIAAVLYVTSVTILTAKTLTWTLTKKLKLRARIIATAGTVTAAVGLLSGSLFWIGHRDQAASDSALLAACLTLNSAVAIMGTVCNLKEERPGNRFHIRPLGWAFVVISLVSMVGSIYWANRTLVDQKAETEKLHSQLLEQKTDTEKLYTRLHRGAKNLDILAVGIVLTAPAGQDAYGLVHGSLDPTRYLGTVVVQSDRFDYKFVSGSPQQASALVFWRKTEGRPAQQIDQPLKVKADIFPASKGDVLFLFPLALNELGLSNSLGSLDGAKVTFGKTDLDTESFHPEYFKRIELLANTSGEEVRLVCVNIIAEDWERIGGALSLKVHGPIQITLANEATCDRYPIR